MQINPVAPVEVEGFNQIVVPGLNDYNPQGFTICVTDFGAKGNGVTDDTAAIQAAIDQVKDAGRGEVWFPTGTYIISSPLIFYSNMIIRGNGREATKIYAANYSATSSGQSFPGYMFTASPINDADYVTFKDFSMRGPGLNAVTGSGIYIATTGNNRHNVFENLVLEEFAGNGIRIDTPILTSFKNVRVRYCTGNGFYMNGGTSTCFDNCFATTCLEIGFRFVAHTYAMVSGGGSETNGVAYRLEDSNNITFVSTGCEGMKYRSASYPGVGYWFSNGRNNSIISSYASRFSEDPDTGPAENTFLIFDGEYQDTVIGFRGFTPSGASATSYRAKYNYQFLNEPVVSFVNVTFPYRTTVTGGNPGNPQQLSTGLPEPVVKVPQVRQAVQGGPTDSTSGRPSYLPSTSASLTLTTTGVSTTQQLIVSAANGWYAADNSPTVRPFYTNGGQRDLTGFTTSDLSWTLPASSTSYLFVTINVDGSLTPGSTTLAPVYQFGGTRSTVNGQSTFNIQQMSMTVGDGTIANQAYRVFVGEAVTDATTVTSTVAYAYLGRFRGQTATLALSNVYTLDHGLGVVPYISNGVLINNTAEFGYVAGDIAEPVDSVTGPSATRNQAKIRVGAAAPNVINWSGAGTTAITIGNWRFQYTADRGW